VGQNLWEDEMHAAAVNAVDSADAHLLAAAFVAVHVRIHMTAASSCSYWHSVVHDIS